MTAATPRRLWLMLGVLGAVYVVMFAVGRGVLQSGSGPGGVAGLWAWFLVCVLGGSTAAGRVGRVGVGRGFLSGLTFLLGWLVIAPIIDAAFAAYLPPRPTLFGVALASQLVVLLPARGPLAHVWRTLVPFGLDLGASFMAHARGGLGLWAIVWLTAAFTLIGVLESRTLPAPATEASRSG